MRVAVVDYGCKRSIVTCLAAAGAAVTVYPHDVDADELAGHDGVLLSNGPGDPAALDGRDRNDCNWWEGCRCSASASGHQLLALATGHETYKLPFGHRGANHPGARARRRAACSSPARTTASPSGRARSGQRTHVSLYDGTVEGLDYPELRARSLQFHPEAGPGPHDARPLIDTWVQELRDAA